MAIRLGFNYIGPKGIAFISGSNWKNLVCLNLALNKIGDKGCKFLSKASFQ